jgi:type IV pilus assembly protein PilW
MTGVRQQRLQHGVTLIELMIGLLLGLLVMAIIFEIYVANRRSYVLADALGARQEAIRYVSAVLARDVRMAGYRGCLPDDGEILNTVNPNPTSSGGARTQFTHSDFRYRFDLYVEGFDADGGDWNPELPGQIGDVQPGTDVLTVRGTFGPEVYIVKEMPNSSADLKTNPLSPAPLADGDIVLLTDCEGAAIFQITRYNLDNSGGPSAHFGNIVHNTGNAVSPSNWTQDFGRIYPIGSHIQRIDTVSYFIRPSAGGTGPALWRRVEGDDPAEREIAEGVENMQVLYGVDTTGDQVPDAYQTAAVVDSAGNWRRVVTARVALLVAATRDRAADVDPRSFDLLGTSAGPFADGRLRRVVTLTLSLRNRLP